MEQDTRSQVSGLLTEQKVVALISEHDEYDATLKEIVVPASRVPNRESGLSDHHFHCLPLSIANGYGWFIKSAYDLEVTWDGTEWNDGIKLEILSDHVHHQFVSPHFGEGTITFQNRFTFRGPEGMNVYVTDPANRFYHGWKHLSAVVEIDNLRRDFSHTIKLTKPNETVRINKGDIIAQVIPIPRHYADGYELAQANLVLPQNIIDEERKAMQEFGRQRSEEDGNKPHGNGRLYFNGEDCYGNKFEDHQKRVKRSKCPFSRLWSK